MKKRMALKAGLAGVCFVFPAISLFLVFRFIPFFGGMGLAFAKVDLAGQMSWVGLDNLTRLVDDSTFWKSLLVTVTYTLLSVPMTLLVATVMALLVRRRFPGVRLFRTIFFLPVITSLVLSGIIFVWMFREGGPIPTLMATLGLPGETWTTSPLLALPAIAIVATWSGFGYSMLIILARLQEIPREIEEAALVDRAGPWARFIHITLPELRQVLFFLSVILIVGSFQVFDAVYVMTQGGPVNATYTLGYMLYDQAFRFFEFGYASAVALVLFIMVMAITLIQRLTIGRDDTA